MINRERLLGEFLELVKIDSPTLEERAVADRLQKRLLALGLEVQEDRAGEALGGNCGNLFAYWKGNVPQAPVLLLSAHMDTVQPGRQIEPAIRDGLISSAGETILGADDKSGIAAIMEALKVIDEREIPHGDIQVIFNVAEEGGVNGSRCLDRSLLKGELGFVLDSGGRPGKIILGAPGQDRITVRITGKSAHAGVAPETGINAIVAASKAIGSMRTGRIDEETTANIGTIQGGRATNIVPDQVEITCEARSRDIKKLERQTAHIVECFQASAAELGAKAEVEVRRAYDPYQLERESPVALIAGDAVKGVGLKPQFGLTGGGSDANNYNRYGVPSIVLGTGMDKSHTVDECIREEDLYRSAELVVEIIKRVTKIPGVQPA